MVVEVEALVRDYWRRVWLGADLDAVAELLADPSIRHSSEGTQSFTVAEFRDRIAKALEIIRITGIRIDALSVLGDTVWARVTMQAVSLATAGPMSITWMTQYRVADGRIAETWGLHQSGVDWIQ